jgi:tRNA threonylcarbamoyladenosine biosynthesis protein TsaE
MCVLLIYPRDAFLFYLCGMNDIRIEGLKELGEAARLFLDGIGESRVIAFYGAMGAGKTTFIKALCDVLGVEDDVNSPTFNIINEYRADNGDAVYHFDFYRIEKVSEAMDIGFEEYVYSGDLCLIEWPQNIEQILPVDTLKVQISVLEDGCRVVTF